MGYAGNIGFNVRMGSTKINDQEMVGQRMLCSKQGYTSTTATANIVNEKKQRRIRNLRSGCLTMIYISLDRSSKLWRVVNFIQHHNHPLVTPSKKRYLPVNRVITPLLRTLFQSINTSNISSSDQYCVAVQEVGGFDHIQFTPFDLSNMRRNNRCNIIQRDADLLIELFKERKNKSSDFFFSFTRHEDGSVPTREGSRCASPNVQCNESRALASSFRWWSAWYLGLVRQDGQKQGTSDSGYGTSVLSSTKYWAMTLSLVEAFHATPTIACLRFQFKER
ncbi:hypothetical protein ZOSMA_255G00030 [Zostera marina]|uniref:FAR1 domain-containing protein n=1 Tax=Zostera marina TaxID=29655 RepID=A0A0K9PFX8_ZOSMR|nr:hypothetical protein ZOSMA_255G00030 [Zostera marina]